MPANTRPRPLADLLLIHVAQPSINK